MSEEPKEETAQADAGQSDVRTPEFSEVQQPSGFLSGSRALSSVYDVSVTVTAELGRVELPIADLLQLTEGSVIELNRSITTPTDIRVEGVLLARGEVVVVNDSFAVRLNEVTQAKPPDSAREVA